MLLSWQMVKIPPPITQMSCYHRNRTNSDIAILISRMSITKRRVLKSDHLRETLRERKVKAILSFITTRVRNRAVRGKSLHENVIL